MAKQGRSVATIVLGVAVVAALALYMVIFTVSFTETVVVTTFGKVQRTLNEPNWYLKFPWPIQEVTRFDNRLHVHESTLEQLTTREGQTITVMTFTSWRVPRDAAGVERYLKEIGTRQKAEQVLTTLLHDAVGKVVGSHTFDHFVSTDPKRMQVEKIEGELKDIIADRALRDYGIEVAAVGIKRLELPEEATKKVFDHMKAERETLAEQLRAEGDAKAKEITSTAEEQARTIENRALAMAIQIRGEGDAKAAEYYRVFSANRDLHNFLKRLDALEKMLPKRTTLILDAEQVPPFDLLGSQALTSLMQGAPEGAPATRPSPAAAE